jgi:hypothetical protein
MLGLAMGTITRDQICSSFAPSITAASFNSFGICMKYWRIKNVPVIVTRPGRIRVRWPVIPSARNITKRGISVTWLGIIIVAR